MELFSVFDPHEVLVVDNDPRVLASVNGNGKLRKAHLDTCQAPLPDPMDIIICYNVLQISSDPSKGLEHLLDSVAEGGLLSLETNGYPVIVEDDRYERLNDHLYQRHQEGVLHENASEASVDIV
ncbi:MAG: methyltransferase domain-containing protein [Nanoarchaeota archaeon]